LRKPIRIYWLRNQLDLQVWKPIGLTGLETNSTIKVEPTFITETTFCGRRHFVGQQFAGEQPLVDRTLLPIQLTDLETDLTYWLIPGLMRTRKW
jgi:hypothetical protein